MNDPESRKQGLPITRSRLESLVKEINGRVIGTGPPCRAVLMLEQPTSATPILARALRTL